MSRCFSISGQHPCRESGLNFAMSYIKKWSGGLPCGLAESFSQAKQSSRNIRNWGPSLLHWCIVSKVDLMFKYKGVPRGGYPLLRRMGHAVQFWHPSVQNEMFTLKNFWISRNFYGFPVQVNECAKIASIALVKSCNKWWLHWTICDCIAIITFWKTFYSSKMLQYKVTNYYDF